MDESTGKVRSLPPGIPLRLLLAGLMLLGTGCALKQTMPHTSGIQHELVARDLIFVMAQIVEPDTTTVQLGRSSSGFGQELEKGFREVGYGMQRVSADHGPNFMSYTESTSVSSTSADTFRYSVFVGDIGLERQYRQRGEQGLVPVSPMIVYGTKQNVLLSDLVFPGQNLEVSYRDSEQSTDETPLITVFDNEVSNAIGELQERDLPSYKTFNVQQREIKNIFITGSSNFESLKRNYRVVRSEVVAFADDSLFLLDKGRSQVQRIVKLYRPDSDMIRVVGCSNGPTKFKGGNIALAQGRSARIAQELVKRNVKKESILDEGCWSPNSAGERFPDRGVIIELQRQG